ncbi:MAG: hypothetical protein GY910_03395 [bacterium]|nr:hypothetical protein [bacterium]
MTSSFGDGSTRAFVRDLEVFHAGVLAALGLPLDVQHNRPTRVIAFDGRGLSRPFAERGASASLVPTVDGPILMIRALGDFRERIDPDLRHRYAHRVLRDRTKGPLPLWYEEGRAQLASTIAQSEEVVLVGRSQGEYRRALLDWRVQDLTKAMGRHSLAGASAPDRVRFEARSWAIVHTILFDSPRKRDGMMALDAVRAASESNRPEERIKAVRALGSEARLTERVYDHLEEDRHRVDRMQIGGFVSADLVLEKIPAAVARDRLAELALDLGRAGLAKKYFERALRDRSDFVPSLAGLALADALAGRFSQIDEHVARVGVAAESDAVASSRLGQALTLWAASLPPGTERANRLRSARRYFERSLELDPAQLRARVGLGSSFLVPGTESERAREWFEAARRLSRGALEMEIWLARADLQLGRPNAARFRAEEALSRSHSRAIRKSAREILGAIEERATH